MAENNWIQQFDHFKDEAMAELKKVVDGGLTPTENEVLIWMAKEFIVLAQKHDPEAFAKVSELLC